MMQASLMRPINEISLPTLRKWQARTVEEIRQAIREGHRRIVFQSPTGAGKTLLAGHLFAGSIAKGLRAMFTVPDSILVEQTLRSFERVGIYDIGVIQAQHERTDWEAQVQIASIQTLVRRRRPEVHLVVVDEAHVSFKAFLDMLKAPAWENVVVIGLSATPWAKCMGHHWTKLIIGATIHELIEEGVLCGFRGYGPEEELDRSQIKVTAGEFNEASSSQAMRQARIIGDVVRTWQDRWGQDRTFMFCVDRKHAQEQRDAFNNAGIPFGYIDGTMSRDERAEVFRDFRSGVIKGISSVGCLIRGVDEDVRCIIDCQPTKSEMAHVQKIGRGLRPADGKELLILDHAGNNLALGTVTDIFHDHLDMGMKGDRKQPYEDEKEPPKPKKCPKCHAIVPGHVYKCPNCGEKLAHESKVEAKAGELVEFGSKKAKKDDKQVFYSGLLGLAWERQYGNPEGWAAHKYRERFGVWPIGLDRHMATPSKAVRDFEYKLRLKWAAEKA